MQALMRYRDLVLPLGIIGGLIVILVPMPTAVMDLLLAANITVGVIVLLTTVHVATPLELSVFPSLLLATTMARLVLNVATTRLILTGADRDRGGAAGGVIQSFGEFVAGDRLEVGLILFLIIVLIQFVVITKGATRISEVAARFALDGMPGRQMAIDADVNAGLIDEHQARSEREELRAQADFYGAMDGASKFVRGDAIAGIVIMMINIVGGLAIGWLRQGMSFSEAANVYTKLTIGDGLVSQIPALLISLAAGLLVTRSAKRSSLPLQFLEQILGNPKALMVSGGFLMLMMITNLPAVPMVTLGIGCIGLAVVMNRQTARQAEDQATAARQASEAAAAPAPKRVEDYLAVDPMEMSIGFGLLGLADPARGGDLMQRITGVRNALATDIGIVLPKVRVRDDSELGESDYEIRIQGNPIARATVVPDRMMAIDDGTTTGTVQGSPGRDPVHGGPALWIPPERRDQAVIYGYRVLAPSEILALHLQEIARWHADELLSRDATQHLIDELKEDSPAVVDELIPRAMRISEVQQVLRMLLREDVPIRQLGMILETLGEHADRTKDPVGLCETVRGRLARTISSRYRDARGCLHVVVLDPAMEDRLAQSLGEAGWSLPLGPADADFTCGKIQEAVKKLITAGHPPVVLVSPRIRPGLRELTTVSMPRLKVLSYQEITPDTKIESHGVVHDQ